MCGIAGIVGYEGRVPARIEIEAMTRALAHRGPDGEGVLLRDNVALGHRRLAIIDLASGQQPMANEDGTVWVTYNGEIYNYRELRERLRSLGHVFKTDSDTEVVVHGFEEWGTECVARFRGMFAFAAVDFRAHRCLLARDHFGIKPLYYRVGGDYLAFASELGALLAVEDDVPSGNLRSIDRFLRLQYIPSPDTIYHDVYKLPPASVLELGFSSGTPSPRRYWDFRFEPDASRSDAYWEEALDATLEESVKAHLVSDVPFGVFLSGGIDSTLVASKMATLCSQPVRAFTIAFEEEEASEDRFARQVADRLGIDLRVEILRESVAQTVRQVVAHQGEPFGDSSALPTYLVSRVARSEVPMVLSGDGGDEFFAGYDTHLSWLVRRPRLRQYVMRLAVQRSVVALGRLLGAAKGAVAWRAPTTAQEWQRCVWYSGDLARWRLWKPEYRRFAFEDCALFEDAARRGRSFDRLGFAQYMDVRTYLPCDILAKVDAASMCHGLEVRTPLVDLRVAELAARLPVEQRIRAPRGQGLVGKHLPKALLGRSFDSEFVHRRKTGFAIPRSQWFGSGNPLDLLLEEVLEDSRDQLTQWFAKAELRRIRQRHDAGRDQSGVLWLLLVLGLWLSHHKDVQFSS